jgi:TPP-dependent pyruvate/acetoin dehydrogenase alpha subunit
MKRFAAYDPPEYLDWKADPQVAAAFRERIEVDPERERIIRALDEGALLDLYAGLVRNRLCDVALKRWVKQGVISKAWLGTGEEASTIGPVHALRREGDSRDHVAPLIRNSGAYHEMGISIPQMLRGYLATADSPGGGRNIHLGDLAYGVLTPTAPLGEMIPVAAGIALSFKQTGSDQVVLTWIGDGATKTGAFHEGINFATVQRVPLICIIQNNKVALGTRVDQHTAGSFEDWPAMYGATGASFDGNHVLDAYAATYLAAEGARQGRGTHLLVADTFRMGGHATHDEREARQVFDPALFEEWGRRDPIGIFENWLQEEGVPPERLEEIEGAVSAEVDRGVEEALVSRESAMPAPEDAAAGVYG